MGTPARHIGRVGAAGVDGPAEVHHGRTGRHLRVRELVGRDGLLHLFQRGQTAFGRTVTPRHDARRAVVLREVDERDHGRELQLRVGPRDVAPHQLVAVQPLLLGTRSALQQVAEVQLVARARRQQDAVAQREQQRVAHHVGREGARQARHAGDLLGLGAVERGHDRVEERFVRVGRVDRGFDVVVDALHDVAAQQPFDDDDTVPVDRCEDVVGVAARGEPRDGSAHARERKRHRGMAQANASDGWDLSVSGVEGLGHAAATIGPGDADAGVDVRSACGGRHVVVGVVAEVRDRVR